MDEKAYVSEVKNTLTT